MSEPLEEHHVFVASSRQDLGDSPVNGDQFLIEEIELEEEGENKLHVEVVDADDNVFAQARIKVRYDPSTIPTEAISTLLTKPIKYLGTRGFATIFQEGDRIPTERTHPCTRATLDDFIKIAFYEGDRWLTNLVIPDVDPTLPIGSLIDLHLVISKDYTARATATVRATRQMQQVVFQITRVEVPTLDEMDEDIEQVLEQMENDLETVQDRNLRAQFKRRMRSIDRSYRKARQGLAPDTPGLFALIGELRKLLIEIQGAQEFMEPSYEVFEQLVNSARRFANQLDETSPIPQEDALKKIAALKRMGEQAWEQEDVARWRGVNKGLDKLCQDLRRALSPPIGKGEPQATPETLQSKMLGWLDWIRNRATDAGLEEEFEEDIEKASESIWNVDLRDSHNARNSLMQVVQEQLQPLAFKIKREIKKREGERKMGRKKVGKEEGNVY